MFLRVQDTCYANDKEDVMFGASLRKIRENHVAVEFNKAIGADGRAGGAE